MNNPSNMIEETEFQRLQISQDETALDVILKALGIDGSSPYTLRLQSEFGSVLIYHGASGCFGVVGNQNETTNLIKIDAVNNVLQSVIDANFSIAPAPSKGIVMNMTSTAGLAIVTPYGTWTINRDGIWFGNECRLKYQTTNVGDLNGTESLADLITKVQQIIDALKDDHKLFSDP